MVPLIKVYIPKYKLYEPTVRRPFIILDAGIGWGMEVG